MTPCPTCEDRGYVYSSPSRDGLSWDDIDVCPTCDGGPTGIESQEDAREVAEQDRKKA